ncbi:hypothetical protein ABK040_011814 [Willaertia magna]
MSLNDNTIPPTTTIDCNEIIPRLFLGSEEAALSSLNILKSKPYEFTHICVCGFGLNSLYLNELKYFQLKSIDLPTYNIKKDILKAFHFINNLLEENETNRVLVHCARGVSRSATIVVGYLMLKLNISFEEAYYGIVRKQRNIVCISDSFKNQLIEVKKEWDENKK